MKGIIVDTSSILFGVAKRIDVFEKIKEEFPRYKIVMPSGVMDELKGIGKGRRKESINARYALKMLKDKDVEIVQSGYEVDGWIVKNAAAMGCEVCTNDAELRKRLRAEGVRIVSLGLGGSLR
ncbi:MAG: PIN domain-containing protein [Candidatus Micrarchaeales archaeon]|jgi:rRNA-processing protein FCF1